MLRIGHVDLGTTHPPTFIEAERALGHQPVGVFDDFRIYDAAKSKTFAAEHNIEFFDSLDALAEQVDVAFIHSVNWDLHLAKLLPFIQRGKGVFLDKPMIGNLADLQKIQSLVKGGAKITGGSMGVYADEIRALQKDNAAANIHTAFAGSPNDIYYYGIHTYYMLGATLGYDFARVRYLGQSGQKLFEIEWPNHKKAVVALGDTKSWFPFHMTLMANTGPTHLSIKGSLALPNMLKEVLPFLAGKTNPNVPPIAHLLNCELAALAGLQSEHSNGNYVALSDVQPSIRYDGAAYERTYGKKK